MSVLPSTPLEMAPSIFRLFENTFDNHALYTIRKLISRALQRTFLRLDRFTLSKVTASLLTPFSVKKNNAILMFFRGSWPQNEHLLLDWYTNHKLGSTDSSLSNVENRVSIAFSSPYL